MPSSLETFTPSWYGADLRGKLLSWTLGDPNIVGEAIVSDLGLRMIELKKPLHIVSADGNALDIIGTVNLFLFCQATGDKWKRIEAAVPSWERPRTACQTEEFEEDETHSQHLPA